MPDLHRLSEEDTGGVELLQLLLAVPSAVYSEVGEGLCVPGVLCH